MEIHGYFYNPNIHPYQEFKKRLEGVEFFNHLHKIPLITEGYGLKAFLNMANTENDRCAGCYRTRLEKTAAMANENNFDAFSTSLLYSRRQRHEDIAAIASEIASGYKVEFYYEDYRKGWQVGINISKELGIYRQQYCGCIFSEEERYLGK